MSALATPIIEAPAVTVSKPGVLRRLLRNTSVLIGGVLVLAIMLMGLLAPVLTSADPAAINPSNRNKLPGYETTTRDDEGNKITRKAVMGTDSLGRDIYTRVVYGARVSLVVGLTVAVISVAIGLFIGLLAGYFRLLDSVVMRVMDGLMAIPAILLAIALVSLSGASLLTVILAVTIPEVPRVVRLVRSIVLTIREEPYVEAAISVGTPVAKVIWRHVLPNTIAPLIVQATFIAGAAILLEAILSFLGVGIPPETPTWGNIMAEGRSVFQIFPHNILYPGMFLTLTVLAINLLGDGLRDTLDPRMSKRL
ncbi:MAG: ABC transporter permease [Burkholderiaceae bacterium]|nr:ABC transporter permease [Burkholderiaceae bacterium]